MSETRGITVKIDADLHTRAKADQEARALTMSQYITLILEEHFNQDKKGGITMNARTMAFQIEEELFQRIKAHLSRTGLTQKAFVLGLIEEALFTAELEVLEADGSQPEEAAEADTSEQPEDAGEADDTPADGAPDESEPDTTPSDEDGGE